MSGQSRFFWRFYPHRIFLYSLNVFYNWPWVIPYENCLIRIFHDELLQMFWQLFDCFLRLQLVIEMIKYCINCMMSNTICFHCYQECWVILIIFGIKVAFTQIFVKLIVNAYGDRCKKINQPFSTIFTGGLPCHNLPFLILERASVP